MDKTKIEDICTEILYVKKISSVPGANEDVDMEMWEFFRDKMLSVQRMTHKISNFCIRANEEADKEGDVRYDGFYKSLKRFCCRFSNQAIEHHVGEFRFSLNNLLMVLINALKTVKPQKINFGIRDPESFRKDISYLLNSAVSDLCTGVFAKTKNFIYPINGLYQELEELVQDALQDVTGPSLEFNNSVLPMSDEGDTIVVGSGTWLLRETTGPRVGLFGNNQIPEHRIFRLIMFYSKQTGPKKNYTWDLNGPITFEFGTASEKSIEMRQAAPIIEWQDLVRQACRNAELLPEPFSSIMGSRILKAYTIY